LKSCGGATVLIDGIFFVVGDYKNTASSFVGDFEDFTMQLAVIGDQFCPTVKRIISIALLWVSVPGHG
jgi:hypothetical protein